MKKKTKITMIVMISGSVIIMLINLGFICPPLIMSKDSKSVTTGFLLLLISVILLRVNLTQIVRLRNLIKKEKE